MKWNIQRLQHTSWTLTFHCWTKLTPIRCITIDYGYFGCDSSHFNRNESPTFGFYSEIGKSSASLVEYNSVISCGAIHSDSSFSFLHIFCLLIFIHAVRRCVIHRCATGVGSSSNGIFIWHDQGPNSSTSYLFWAFFFSFLVIFASFITCERVAFVMIMANFSVASYTIGSIRIVRLSHLFIAILMRA